MWIFSSTNELEPAVRLLLAVLLRDSALAGRHILLPLESALAGRLTERALPGRVLLRLLFVDSALPGRLKLARDAERANSPSITTRRV